MAHELNISVVIPALNEQATVAHVVEAVSHDVPFEVLVIDADSTDATAREAAAAGARVVNWRDILPDVSPRPGKGESLWRGVAAAQGDIVVFVDADLKSAAPGLVNTLVAPFQTSHSVAMVKANYRRSFQGKPHGGGRVTELTAKPLLRRYFPELDHIEQPLGGEYAIKRDVALGLEFVGGYGVEVGLLIDVAKAHGSQSITQVDVGTRVHRNRPLSELAPMAQIVTDTILSRAQLHQVHQHRLDIELRPPLRGII